MTELAHNTIITLKVYFNPHEREARDLMIVSWRLCRAHFNPHEREARDFIIPPFMSPGLEF